MYIRVREEKRQARTFPAPDHSRHYKTLENHKLTGHLFPDKSIRSAERERHLVATTPLGINRPP
jgi:hypothetical protein